MNAALGRISRGGLRLPSKAGDPLFLKEDPGLKNRQGLTRRGFDGDVQTRKKKPRGMTRCLKKTRTSIIKKSVRQAKVYLGARRAHSMR